MTFAFVRTRCHSHWLWQGQMSQPYFMILRRRPQGLVLDNIHYSLWLWGLRGLSICRCTAHPHLVWRSCPCNRCLLTSSFFFSTLRNHHCEQATAMMALCVLTCFSISSMHYVVVTSSSSGLFSKGTVAIRYDSHNTKSKWTGNFVWGLGVYRSPSQGLQRRKDIERWQWFFIQRGGRGCSLQKSGRGPGERLQPLSHPCSCPAQCRLQCTIVLTLLWSCSVHCQSKWYPVHSTHSRFLLRSA